MERHWEFLTGLTVTLVLYLFGDTIKAFLRVRPQRIRLWLLKARIAGDEGRLVRLTRIRNEPSFAIYCLLIPAILIFFLLTLYGLLLCQIGLDTASHIPTPVSTGNVIGFCTLSVIVVIDHTFRDFKAALESPDSIKNIELKIEKLRSRLPQEPTPPSA